MSAPISRLSRNARTAFVCLAIFVGMTGMAFAAVPLYRAFCNATGYDGTISRAKVAPDTVLEKTVTVHFDANVHDIPWTFHPSQNSQTVKIGAQNLAFYKVTNRSDKAITGRAAYNILPETAGAYFQKLQCFCFSDQTIQPGETVEFPVIYFVDPKFATNSETKRMTDLTLSYTFFQVADQPKTVAAKSPASPGLGEPPRAGL
jgi:cytochrome c oxidase assembly protein subunit 11